MTDTKTNQAVYVFGGELDVKDIRDIAASAGLTFEEENQDLETDGDFNYDERTRITGSREDYSHTRFFGRTDPGEVLPEYDGELSYEGHVEYIVGDQSMTLGVLSKVHNRQGPIASGVLKDMTMRGVTALDSVVENREDVDGGWMD